MKVKLLTSRAGARWTQQAGDVIDVDNAEGQRLIEKGRAVPVRDSGRRKATRDPEEER